MLFFAGGENFILNQVQLHRGKKTFLAKVTESFPHGYTLETVIDGKPLHLLLLANKPIPPQIFNHNKSRKRTGQEVGVTLNGGYNGKSRTSRTIKQDVADHVLPDSFHVEDSTSHKHKTEVAAAPCSKNLGSSNVFQAHEDGQIFLESITQSKHTKLLTTA